MPPVIKVVDENFTAVDSVIFEDNLTCSDVPEYMNFNGRIGLTRCTSEKYAGELVICYFYPDKQEDSYAEFITDKTAYQLCAKRNKLELADKLGINLHPKEREVW